MEKYIFLDVDGVINIPPYKEFDEGLLDNVRHLIHKTGSKVVISSSLRRGVLGETKRQFPMWLQEHIVGETVRGYHYTIKGSNLPIVRGNEIKQWLGTRVVCPWHAYPERDAEFRILNPDGSFQQMRRQIQYVDYNYVILDDDDDMLYEHRNNFVHCDGLKGFTQDKLEEALAILKPI